VSIEGARSKERRDLLVWVDHQGKAILEQHGRRKRARMGLGHKKIKRDGRGKRQRRKEANNRRLTREKRREEGEKEKADL